MSGECKSQRKQHFNLCKMWARESDSLPLFRCKKKEKNVRHRSREVPRRPNEGRDMLCHWFDESLVCTELNKNNFSFFFSVPYGSHTTTFTLIQNTAISNEKDTSLKARSARNTNYCSRVNEACASLVSKPKKN